jgi:chromosome segregation ATPase
MSSDYDATEFIDGDFQGRTSPRSAAAAQAQGPRAPSREEVDAKVAEAQRKLAELKRAQEELERERSALEETRRRQAEFQSGRTEMVQNLTRGVGLLEEAEFSARRDAEQMSKSLVDMREALAKIQVIQEDTWTQENFNVELTRALTTLENARMEWNTARLKFTQLSGATPAPEVENVAEAAPIRSVLGTQSFGELCRLGFALTWPVAAAILGGIVVVTVLLLRH